MPTPQLLLTLSPEGGLIVELPAANGSRRQVSIDERTAGKILLKMLHAQIAGDPRIGHEAAPTNAQVKAAERLALTKAINQFVIEHKSPEAMDL